MDLRHRRNQFMWTIPMLYATCAVLGGLILPRVETTYFPNSVADMSVSAAMAIFTSIGSGMIALSGIVFSLAFVMIQFSAMAYSPRLVLWVAGDRVLWHGVGIFTATFLYSIAATAWIDHSGSGRVPFFSSWLVIVLLLGSVAIFVSLIRRVSLLQVHHMLQFTSEYGRDVIAKMYQNLPSPVSVRRVEDFQDIAVTQTLSHAGRPRAIQTIDVPALLKLADDCGGILEVTCAVGDTVVDGRPLLRVRGGKRELAGEAWRKTFQLGDERTFEQDPKYAIRLLVDIAIKALSPAINDPTTAVQALNHIEDLLLQLGRRRLEIGAYRDAQGALRLVMSYPSWEDFLVLAFDEIRFCGATSIQVMRRMKAMVADLVAALPGERHAALEHYKQRLDMTIARSFADVEEKEDASLEDRQGLGVPRRP